jgi:hypothetical protein
MFGLILNLKPAFHSLDMFKEKSSRRMLVPPIKDNSSDLIWPKLLLVTARSAFPLFCP